MVHPDLAPSDYFLFPNLAAGAEYFAGKDKNYFFDGIEKLIERCKKCINVRGGYIEK